MARPRIVIVGGGFGGLSAAQALAGAPVDVTLIDRRNYHLFQPLLYQVATAGLSPARHRRADPRHPAQRSRTSACCSARSSASTASGATVDRRRPPRSPTTIWSLATGARHAYFGHDDWESVAPGPEDDRRRDRHPPPHPARLRAGRGRADPAERAAAADLRGRRRRPDRRRDGGRHRRARAQARWRHDFRRIDPARRAHRAGRGRRRACCRPFAERCRRSGAALARAARRRGAARHAGHRVRRRRASPIGDERIAAAHRHLGGRRHGVAARPNGSAPTSDRAGRVMVEPDLSRARPSRDLRDRRHRPRRSMRDGKPLPGVAPVAKQQGAYVARVIARAARRPSRAAPFRYRNYGNLATIGRKRRGRRLRLAQARRHRWPGCCGASCTSRS